MLQLADALKGLSDSSEIHTHNHLVRKRTLNHSVIFTWHDNNMESNAPYR